MADPAGSSVRTVVAVLAAPAGEPAAPALFAPLAGRPVIEHSVAAFEASPVIDEILVVTPPALAARTGQLLAVAGYRKVSRVIGGRATRIESAWEAIRILGAARCNLLLHDAARPLIGPRVIEDCVAALRTCPAACAAVPASDTMVKVDKDLITERPPRDRLRRRQTPQGFRLEVIRRGYELAFADPGFAPADDCGIVLRYLPEVPVRLVPGSERSVTVTGPADIQIAEALLALESRHSHCAPG
jgi:ribitol-5-phosphate 2-dehydrogenase (NADP+) / D-ribitol-5-phosphate cytidylyltransferase